MRLELKTWLEFERQHSCFAHMITVDQHLNVPLFFSSVVCFAFVCDSVLFDLVWFAVA